MFKHITITAQFAETGHTFYLDTELPKGSSLVHGANESGKSFQYCECIRYALYGSQALRGPLSTITKLEVELTLRIRDCDYTISRGLDKASIIAASGDLLASGQVGVTNKVADLCGFGMPVADVSTFCPQGRVDELIRLQPAKRKQLVDRVLGLDQLDGMQDYAAKRQTETNAVAKAAAEGLGPRPEEPAKPDRFRPSSERRTICKLLQGQVSELEWLNKQILNDDPVVPEPLKEDISDEALQERIEKLQMQAGQVRLMRDTLQGLQVPPKPEAVAKPDCALDLQGLTQEQERRDVYMADYQKVWDQLRNFRPRCPHTAAELDQFRVELANHNAWQMEQNFIMTHPSRPTKTSVELAADMDTFWNHRYWEEAHAHRLALDKGALTCPHCHKPVPVNQVEYDRVRAQEAELERFRERTLPEGTSAATIRADIDAATIWESHTPAWTGDEPARPRYNDAELERMTESLAHAADFDELDRLEAELEKHPDRTQQIRQVNNYLVYEHKCRIYEFFHSQQVDLENQLSKLANVTQDLNAARELQARKLQYAELCDQYEQQCMLIQRRKPLQSAPEKLAEQRQLLSDSVNYELTHQLWCLNVDRWAKDCAEAEKLQEEATSWKQTVKAIKAARTRIKGYFVPSLNAVASHLLQAMTAGAHQSLKVSPDFGEIRVDGQLLETLSGGAAAVTNLAIRVALGKVLTHNVLPAFIADEVDANMDNERSRYTMNCMARLRSEFEQIICISHQKLEGVFDNDISVDAG